MAITKRQRSLKKWGKQKWRTKSGKKSSITGERYLPTAAIRSLTAAEYAATTRAKRRDKKKGKQFSKQPKKIAAKTRRFRFRLFFPNCSLLGLQSVFFGLRFGFLVNNCIYDQILVKILSKSSQINKQIESCY